MSNVRYAILESLKTELEKIKKSNGYQTDVALVSRQFQSWGGLTSEKFPALFVLDDGNEVIDNDSGGGEWIFSECRPAIVGYVRDEKDVAKAFGLLDTDLKKLLYSNPDLGDNCKQILFEGYDAIFTIDDVIIFQLRPLIIYDFPKSDP